jgi:diguanylate cyclase (GGDEF)-like protein/PAS domain S-box-containing protein
VVKFGGVRFETLADGVHADSPFSFVRALIEDQRGKIWGATAGGLLELDGAKSLLWGAQAGLSHPYLNALVLTPEGPLVGTGGEAVWLYQGGQFHSFPDSHMPSGPRHVHALLRDRTSRTWVAADDGLWTLEPLTPTLSASTTPHASSIKALALRADGGLWAGGTDGVVHITPAGTAKAEPALEHLDVRALVEDRDGGLWIGTDQALARYANQKLELAADVPGGISALLEDRQGALWVGTTEGLVRYQVGAFITQGAKEGLVEEPLAIAQAQSGGAFIVSSRGAVLRLAEGAPRELYPPGTVSGQGMLGITERSEGGLWLASDTLVGLPEDGRTKVSLGRGPFSLVTQDGSGLLLVETEANGLSRVLRAEKKRLQEIALPHALEHIQRVLRDRRGGLWLSSGGTGLLHVDGGKSQLFATKDGLPSDTVYGILEDPDGRIWVATRHGLAVVEGGRVQPLTQLECTPRRSPVHLFLDGRDALWVTADDGVHRLWRSELLGALTQKRTDCSVRTFGKRDGLRSVTVSWRANGQASLKDGSLCYATTRGLSCAKPNLVPELGPPPRPFILRGTSGAPFERLMVRDREAPLVLGYAAYDLANADLLEFRSRLVGYDRQWSLPNRDASVRYTNLPPGNYTFEVETRYRGQSFGPRATAAVAVPPLWHETQVARLLLALFGLTLLSGTLGVWRARARRQRLELEALVQERTSELALQVEATEARESEVRESAALLDQRVHERTAALEIAMRALQKSEERYQLAAAGADNGIWDWDIAAGVLHLSPRFKQMLGYDESFPSTIEGWLSRTHPDDRATLQAVLLSAAEKGGNIRCEYRMIDRSGEPRWMLCRGTVLTGPGGSLRAAGSQSDITAQKEIEAELLQQGTHDPLTGLPGRRIFVDRLEQAQRQAIAGGSSLALILFNVDRFRSINESYGHEMGDAVLRMVASRAQATLRTTDTVARLGSDEFALLLPTAPSESELDAIIGRLRTGLVLPTKPGQTTRTISLSFGVKTELAAAQDANALLRDAELALEDAKSRGGGAQVHFTHSLGAVFHNRIHAEGGLRRALRENHFVLHYQPLTCLKTGATLSFEALVRWNDPRRGLIGPGEFIATAEASGLIEELSRWVLSEATSQIARWKKELGVSVKVSINIAPRTLTSTDFFGLIMSELERQGVEPSNLGIEILETSLLETSKEVVHTLQRLRDRGVGIAIDDFGTGYSSLAYLSKLPLTSVKLDRSLIEKVPSDPAETAICKAMVQMARQLGVTSVVEGVETAAQVEFLKEIGCDVAQGYFFSRPLTSEKCRELLLTSGAKGAQHGSA